MTTRPSNRLAFAWETSTLMTRRVVSAASARRRGHWMPEPLGQHGHAAPAGVVAEQQGIPALGPGLGHQGAGGRGFSRAVDSG